MKIRNSIHTDPLHILVNSVLNYISCVILNNERDIEGGTPFIALGAKLPEAEFCQLPADMAIAMGGKIRQNYLGVIRQFRVVLRLWQNSLHIPNSL